MNELAEPPPVGFAHLPDVGAAMGQPITITNVWPEGSGGSSRPDSRDDRHRSRGRLGPPRGMGRHAARGRRRRSSASGRDLPALAEWPGHAHRDRAPGRRASHRVSLDRPPVWSLGWSTFSRWFWEFHGALLDKHLVYTLAALLIVALGARGITASLMTLAFLLMGSTDDGPLDGRRMARAGPGPGAAGLHAGCRWPSRFPSLVSPSSISRPDRRSWTATRGSRPRYGSSPCRSRSSAGLTTAYLLGAEIVAPAVAWLAFRPWVFNICWGIGLASNVAIVIEAVLRYRRSSDKVARHHIQTVLATGVPGMFAYVLMTAVPLTAANLGVRFRWPWPIHVGLETIVLLSAFGLAYAVAVRRAMSPRTALRQGIQYALARKTLGLLTMLPAVLLIVELSGRAISRSRRSSSASRCSTSARSCSSWPGLRYRDAAQKWLDRRFFRSDYDATGDPALARQPRAARRPIRARCCRSCSPTSKWRCTRHRLPCWPRTVAPTKWSRPASRFRRRSRRPAGMVQLLQWSDAPLEVFLNDPRSTVGRLPASDREWLRASGAALLVPVLAGTSVERPLVGFIVLGPKRSEESYTSEDRRLLAGIAAQMGLALDLVATAASGGRHAARLSPRRCPRRPPARRGRSASA